MVSIDQHEMVGRGSRQPFQHPRAKCRSRKTHLPSRAEESRDVMIDPLLRRRRQFRMDADGDAGSSPPLSPAFLLQLPIPGAYRIGMKRETPRQLPCARQPVPRTKFVTQHRKNHLRDQLPVYRHFAAVRKPKPHTSSQVFVRSCQLSIPAKNTSAEHGRPTTLPATLDPAPLVPRQAQHFSNN